MALRRKVAAIDLDETLQMFMPALLIGIIALIVLMYILLMLTLILSGRNSEFLLGRKQ